MFQRQQQMAERGFFFFLFTSLVHRGQGVVSDRRASHLLASESNPQGQAEVHKDHPVFDSNEKAQADNNKEVCDHQ
jgi:hypothetical protein